MPYEIFVAHLEAGSHQQLIIRDLIESYNLKIGAKRAPGYICAIAALESIYTKYGYQTLNRTLRLVIAAWEGDCNSLTANMLKSIAILVNTYRDKLDDELFKEKLGAVSIKVISRTAKERHPGTLGYAEAMILIYNGRKKGNQNKLPIGMLYAKDYEMDGLDEDEDSQYIPSYSQNDDADGLNDLFTDDSETEQTEEKTDIEDNDSFPLIQTTIDYP